MNNMINDSDNGLGITIFISGPITGHKDYKEKFNNAEKWLTDLNFSVFNPTNISPSYNLTNCMSMCVSALLASDWVYMLDGWENSKGATIEHDLAKYVGKHIAYEKSKD